jgi:phospholipase/carboxylesterase
MLAGKPPDAGETAMSDGNKAQLEAIAAFLGPLLNGLETLVFVGRHLHPPSIGELLAAIAGRGEELDRALEAFRAHDWPSDIGDVRRLLDEAGTEAQRAYHELAAAPEGHERVFLAYRALRHLARANEALYPMASFLPPVSAYFLPAALRGDAALRARVAASRQAENAGVMHVRNTKQERGGFSVYVPEHITPDTPAPLVMALHGGSGHGRDFLWSWLPDARARGAIVVSPTSSGGTWSLQEPELDAALLARILDEVRRTWPVDAGRMMLTGMSDGGTFTYLAGLAAGSPFTHLAPVAASFHPMLLGFLDSGRVRSTPLTIVHGALDWMFPVAMARDAERSFQAAGAPVRYVEMGDLSHTYPRDANAGLLDWMLG